MYGYSNYQQPYGGQITRVNGENGARAFSMMPNSSTILLDENDPLIWLCVTDGAGYKTVKPYTIKEYIPEPVPDVKALMERLTRLEAKLNESNSTDIKQE